MENLNLHRRRVLRALAAGGVCASLPSLSAAKEGYPEKPITLIVPQPVGGDADAVCRMLQPQWQNFLGQSVIVNNKAGAAGNIGTSAGARAPNDGYTYTFVNQGTMSINPFLYKDPGFKVESLMPVSWLTSNDLIICAHPSVGASNLAEFLAKARAKPGEYTYGTAGNGSANHLAGEMLKSMAKVDLVHVPYKGGGPAIIGALGGEISTVVAFPIAALPHIKSGKLKALAVTGPRRSPVLPDVPTVQESGVAGYEFVSWMGIVAPEGTAEDRIARFSDATSEALRDKAVSEKLKESMMVPSGAGPDVFRAQIQGESRKLSALISQLKLSID